MQTKNKADTAPAIGQYAEHRMAKRYRCAGQGDARQVLDTFGNQLDGAGMDELVSAANAHAKLVSDRAELMEALNTLEGQASIAAGQSWKTEYWEPLANAIQHARAAIAKAEKGEA